MDSKNGTFGVISAVKAGNRRHKNCIKSVTSYVERKDPADKYPGAGGRDKVS